MPSDKNNNGSTSGQIQIKIADLLNDVQPILGPECCIYKVPEHLKKDNDYSYTPRLISIGPIHYNEEQPKPMEKQKAIYLDAFCKRVSEPILKEYITFLGHSMQKIQKCYSEKFQPDDCEFVRMILLDSVFIMELFLRNREKIESKKDYMFNKLWLYSAIQRDLLLLENQLPFFVLEELYQRCIKNENDSFLGLAREYFQNYDQHHEKTLEEINKEKIFLQGWDKPQHFIDLIRFFHVPNDLVDVSSSCRYVVNGATRLRGAGITFHPVSNKCSLDITFDKKPFLNTFACLSCLPFNCVRACLNFPQFTVDDSTEYVFRNLIAFEQCHYPQLHYICSYVVLLDSLIKDKEDAAVLVESGVIVNQMSTDQDLAYLFNSLCKNVTLNPNFYGFLTKPLYEHYHNGWNKTMADLKLVYFRNLWRGTATAVAIIFLFINLYNFVRSVINPKSNS